jgi:hypothetical protein
VPDNAEITFLLFKERRPFKLKKECPSEQWQVISFRLIPLKTSVSFRWTVPVSNIFFVIGEHFDEIFKNELGGVQYVKFIFARPLFKGIVSQDLHLFFSVPFDKSQVATPYGACLFALNFVVL